MPRSKSFRDENPVGEKENAYTDHRILRSIHEDKFEEEFDGNDWDGLTVNIFQSFKDALRGKDIYVEAVPGGRWCGLELYFLSPLGIKGLNVPSDFRYRRPLLPDNDEDLALVLKAACDAADTECDGDKKRAKQWFELVNQLTSQQGKKDTRLALLAQGRARTSPFKVRTITGRYGAHIVLPEREWFPESVQNVDPLRLLSIMPPAEAETFMLNLGRAVVGSSGNEMYEGAIIHDYRYFAGLIGDASIGKSQLVGFIQSAMEKLGYKTSEWNLRQNNPFGWAERLMSDWCTLKDVPTKQTPEIINNPYLKPWSSGDSVVTEAKGLGDVTIKQPTSGGFLFLANGLNIPALVMSDDSGVTDRFLPLACYELEELKAMYGTAPGVPGGKALAGMTGFMWESISAECGGVSMDVLAAWLMRCAADFFIELAGYDVSKDCVISKVRVSKIKTWVYEQRSKLRYNFELNTRNDVVSSIKHSIAWYISEQKRPQALLDMLPDVEFNYHLLNAVVGFTVEPGSNKVPEPLKDLRMNQLAPVTSGEFFKANARKIKQLAEAASSPLDAFKFITNLLRTKGDGFGYPSNPVAYANLWRSALKEIPILVKKYEDLAVDYGNNAALQGLCVNMGGIFNEINRSKGS